LVVDEFQAAGKNGTPKSERVEMLMMRFSSVLYWALVRHFGICSKLTALHDLLRTVQSHISQAGYPNDTDPFFWDRNRENCLRYIDHASKWPNIMATRTAVSLAHDLALKHRKKSIEVLISCNYPNLIAQIRDLPYPSKRGCTTWQKKIVFASQTDKPAKK
jgi:hypothetical protein